MVAVVCVYGVVMGLYVTLMLLYAIGWKKQKEFTLAALESTPLVSVVIALRNEEENLPRLLASLKGQTYSNLEILLVNDHSTDASQRIVDEWNDHRVVWISSDGMGKKAALRAGIQCAKGEMILTTDADTILPDTWVATMVAAFMEQQPALLIGPVSIQHADAWQRTEYYTLEGTTVGSATMGMPVLCSGANLAFTAAWYQQCLPLLKPQIASGDDMFLLEATQKLKGKVACVKSKEATVYIEVVEDASAYLRQRARWASKAPHYTRWNTWLAATIVALTQVATAGVWYLAYEQKYFFFVFVVKFIAEACLLKQVADYHRTDFPWQKSLLISMVYPFYTFVVALFAILPQQWKERKI